MTHFQNDVTKKILSELTSSEHELFFQSLKDSKDSSSKIMNSLYACMDLERKVVPGPFAGSDCLFKMDKNTGKTSSLNFHGITDYGTTDFPINKQYVVFDFIFEKDRKPVLYEKVVNYDHHMDENVLSFKTYDFEMKEEDYALLSAFLEKRDSPERIEEYLTDRATRKRIDHCSIQLKAAYSNKDLPFCASLFSAIVTLAKSLKSTYPLSFSLDILWDAIREDLRYDQKLNSISRSDLVFVQDDEGFKIGTYIRSHFKGEDGTRYMQDFPYVLLESRERIPGVENRGHFNKNNPVMKVGRNFSLEDWELDSSDENVAKFYFEDGFFSLSAGFDTSTFLRYDYDLDKFSVHFEDNNTGETSQVFASKTEVEAIVKLVERYFGKDLDVWMKEQLQELDERELE